MKNTTLRFLNDFFREDEIVYGDPASDWLACLLGILRSIEQKEIATNEGIAASMNRFVQLFGEVTTPNVDKFMGQFSDRVLDKPIPWSFIIDVINSD